MATFLPLTLLALYFGIITNTILEAINISIDLIVIKN